MNFISHFYLDRELEDSLFFVGVSSPDLVSIFDRNAKMKAGSLPLIMENESSDAEISFYNGIHRHFEGDKIFHSSEFFKVETADISKRLKDHFGKDQISRGFFIAHIALELLLDKILIQENPGLLEAYYSHLPESRVDEFVQLSEWACGKPLPGYEAFLKKFIQQRYLARYYDMEHVIFVLKRIMQGVGIRKLEFLHNPELVSLFSEYEKELTKRYFDAFVQFNEQLCRV